MNGSAVRFILCSSLILHRPSFGNSAPEQIVNAGSTQEKEPMPENKAHELLRKHNIHVDDVKERRTSLHHLRHIVHSEQLPFDVFKALVKMRR
jgi:hypothetical protein